jgi:NIPSNAP protein
VLYSHTMSNANSWLLEIRLFTLKPGTRAEFDRISREGTIPLMRSLGITVVAHGPSLNNDNGYFLLRAFPSEQDRLERGQSLYTTPEWLANYDDVVPPMIDAYDTAVLSMDAAAFRELAGVS